MSTSVGGRLVVKRVVRVEVGLVVDGDPCDEDPVPDLQASVVL